MLALSVGQSTCTAQSFTAHAEAGLAAPTRGNSLGTLAPVESAEPTAIGNIHAAPIQRGGFATSTASDRPSHPIDWTPIETDTPPPASAQRPQLVQYEFVEQQPNVSEQVYEGVYPDTADMEAGTGGEYMEYGSQILPPGILYRAYLAGEKESRMRSVWNYDATQGWKWDLTLGGHVGLYRYGSTGNARPVGFQIDLEGAGLVRLDPEEDRDVDAADFRGGFPITWGTESYQVKFAYYHLSSHLGDEFLLKHPTYPRLNFSRDVLVLGHSYYWTDELRLYGEVGYAIYSDVSLQWEFQFGIDYAPAVATGLRGAPFAAVNAHLREEVNYGGNFVVQAGWAWRRSPSSGLFRVGAQYYNGKSDQFSFYNDNENKYGFGIWYDF